MDRPDGKIIERDIEKEMRTAYIDYAMSVIVQRALPDVRDGFKPVHRRILYAMHEDGITPDKPYRKCANTVGSVLGRYHPHGDSSVYDAMVRMAQDFSLRYMMIDGHGNFGSIDGDGAAAMRYTEARMSKISEYMLTDIEKNTVDFMPNYDERLQEPTVLPARIPNLLVNGSSGIAVGMATNIPPHNLTEVINGIIRIIDEDNVTDEQLMEEIKGPDFPTEGIILGREGIREAYKTGRGKITVRAEAEIEEMSGNKQRIIVTSLPYQVNKAKLIENISKLVREKRIEGISDLRDESDRNDRVRIVIELKRDANAQVVLNQLYKNTQMQDTFGIIMLALVDGEPKILTLRQCLDYYIDHRKTVILRRTQFELDKALARAHILEGLKIALDHIDAVIKLIRASQSDEEAKQGLMNNFNLSEVQAEAILEMRLRRLTGLERDKIEEELNELLKLIEELRGILASEEKVLNIIKEELLEIKDKYGDKRRTDIDMTAIEYIEDESLIPEENVLIAMTNKGYIKRTTSDTFKAQKRGGMGIKGMTTNDEDFVEEIINISSHDHVLFFTNKGKVYRIKGYEIPEFNRQSKGLPIINLIPIEKDETISSILGISSKEDTKYLLFATKQGLVKKTSIEEFANIRTSGKICINLKENDELIAVKRTNGNNYILLGSETGRMVKFHEDKIRAMGRTASGVKGINLDGSKCVCAEVVDEDNKILLVTEKGYGKKTLVSDFRETSRGSKGVKALNITEKNGNIAAVKVVDENKELVIMTNTGTTMRMTLDQINTLGRVTQGVRLIHLKDDQYVTTISLVEKEESENIEEDIQINEEQA